MRLAFAPYTLDFKDPAGTSRGVLLKKPTYFIKIWDESDTSRYGIGEAAYFPGLSPENHDLYEYKLIETLANVAIGRPTDLSAFPSIQFGLEQAIYDFSNGCRGIYFPSEFTKGNKYININGLVWMGSEDEMRKRIQDKINSGFKCIKIKIGAIEWKSELKLLQEIRKNWSENDLQIRVDANGGFNMDNVFPVLKSLADIGIHSIEQPIPPGNSELMGFVCKMSPLPVALDESLIGLFSRKEKETLLKEAKPEYIILKPSLCGGFSGASEWIELATRYDIGWWITSALESNVGLNALAQWTASLNTHIPQGLGTGALYTNNFDCPLELNSERLGFNPEHKYDYSQFDRLDWRI